MTQSSATPGGEPTRTWGLREVVGGALTGYLVGVFFQVLVEAVWQGGRAGLQMGPTEKLAVTTASLVGLWIGLAGAAVVASRTRGSGSIAADLGFRLRPTDIPLGIAIGVACQLALVPLLYLPWEALDHKLSRQLSQPAHQLAGGYHGAELAVIGILVTVGSPVVEELYFRGLVLSSLVRWLGNRRGGRRGVVVAVIADALVFALFHFEPLQFLGLAALGVVLAVAVRITGRLGPSIFAHAAFNAVTVIALAAGH